MLLGGRWVVNKSNHKQISIVFQFEFIKVHLTFVIMIKLIVYVLLTLFVSGTTLYIFMSALPFGYIVKCFKLCFPLMLRTLIHFHVYIILDFPITYRNVSVLCQSECACLHNTVNMAVFFIKSNEKIPTKKGEHSCKCTELSL